MMQASPGDILSSASLSEGWQTRERSTINEKLTQLTSVGVDLPLLRELIEADQGRTFVNTSKRNEE